MLDQIAAGSLIPHGYCISWQPDLVAAFVVGNLLIALSYFTIPLVILRFIRQRRDIDYRYLHWLFAGFIVTCGITHLLHVVELWYPVYYLEAVFDLLTAAISIIAAIVLWRILPLLVSLPGVRQLQAASEEMGRLSGTLREKEAQLRSIGDSLPGSYLYEYTKRNDQPKFLYISSGVQRLNGIGAEIVLADAMALLGQVDPVQYAAYAQAEAESQRSMTDFSMDLRMLHSNGEWRWIRVRSRPRLRENGEVVWDGIATDITDQHLYETEINRLAQAVEQNPTGVLITNTKGEPEYMNTACSRITGYRFAEAYGRTWRELISTEMGDAQFAEINGQLESGKAWAGQLPSRHKDGNLFWEQLSISPIFDDTGKVGNYLLLRQDITKQKQAEDLLQQRSSELARANADLVRFADVSAHHLMEPTRRLTMYARRLRSHLDTVPAFQHDPETGSTLDILEHESDRLRNLVRDIQLYLAAAQPRGEVSQQDANLVLQKLRQQMSARLNDPGAALVVDSLPPATIDSQRLTDLFALLLDNALNHGHPRDGATPLRITVSGERGDRLSRYRVADNGPGIPGEYRERVFGIFERLSTGADSGSGIGLSIARRIVESRQGRIWIEPATSGGVVVVFELPD